MARGVAPAGFWGRVREMTLGAGVVGWVVCWVVCWARRGGADEGLERVVWVLAGVATRGAGARMGVVRLAMRRAVRSAK